MRVYIRLRFPDLRLYVMLYATVQDIVMQLVETQLNTHMNAQGILLDGFPRDIDQVHSFEDKVSGNYREQLF